MRGGKALECFRVKNIPEEHGCALVTFDTFLLEGGAEKIPSRTYPSGLPRAFVGSSMSTDILTKAAAAVLRVMPSL